LLSNKAAISSSCFLCNAMAAAAAASSSNFFWSKAAALFSSCFLRILASIAAYR
jgi:hypothetical protein